MTKMPIPYPAYKLSHIKWLSDVPAHWEVLPGRACYIYKQIINKELREKIVLSLSYGSIVIRPKAKLHGLVPASFTTYQIVEPGDIICRSTDLQNDWNSLRFGLSQHLGIITSAYMCLNTRPQLTNNYGYLLLHAYDLMKVFYGLGSGLRQNLGWADFKLLPCLVPSLPEQAAIVRFLSHADRRILRYIRAKEKLIALLEEQKQVIIHQAVTGQIDVRTDQPYPAHKSSDVKWLSDVPVHWEVVPLCSIAKIKSITNQEERELLSVYLDMGVIRFADVKEKRTNVTSEDLSKYQAVDPGDFVLNNQQAWRGSIGVSKHTGIVSPAYLVLSLDTRMTREFANLLFRDQVMVAQYLIASKGVGSIQRNLYWPHFKRIPTILPSASEQTAIARFLNETTASIDRSVDRARRQIELLREYRTRLIADVVTGKLDVREAAAKLPEVDPLAADDALDGGNATDDGLDSESEIAVVKRSDGEGASNQEAQT